MLGASVSADAFYALMVGIGFAVVAAILPLNWTPVAGPQVPGIAGGLMADCSIAPVATRRSTGRARQPHRRSPCVDETACHAPGRQDLAGQETEAVSAAPRCVDRCSRVCRCMPDTGDHSRLGVVFPLQLGVEAFRHFIVAHGHENVGHGERASNPDSSLHEGHFA